MGAGQCGAGWLQGYFLWRGGRVSKQRSACLTAITQLHAPSSAISACEPLGRTLAAHPHLCLAASVEHSHALQRPPHSQQRQLPVAAARGQWGQCTRGATSAEQPAGRLATTPRKAEHRCLPSKRAGPTSRLQPNAAYCSLILLQKHRPTHPCTATHTSHAWHTSRT